MRFHHIAFFTVLGLISAGASLASDPSEAERIFSERLDQRVEKQLAALVSEQLANEVESIRVPSATPPARPAGPSTPVASATSARALPNGELGMLQLACESGPDAAIDCTVSPDTTRGAEITSLAIKGR